MPEEDKNFGGSLVLDFRKWWRHVKTIYILRDNWHFAGTRRDFSHAFEVRLFAAAADLPIHGQPSVAN